MEFSDRLAVLPQYALPKQFLTRMFGRFADSRCGWLTSAAIHRFAARYAVNMAEAENPDLDSYNTFNDFFTRALQPGARPLAASDLICPVDGTISQFGQIQAGQIFQAKGHSYTALALLGGDAALATAFHDGSFATLYLSPSDYHRIHMPCSGNLVRMIHVPGSLFSVNPVTARGVPGLFARNERLICLFNAEHGPFVLILVGATIVGSIATVWHGRVNQPRCNQLREWRYAKHPQHLQQGDEMGRFMLGSTVIALFPQTDLEFNQEWKPGKPIRMGETMAGFQPSDK